MNKSISIIIPAYNEEILLEKSVLVAQYAIESSQNHGEIIVIDDGSSDGTYDVALTLKNKYKNIKVIRHKANLGLGAAYKTGVSASTSEFIMLLPGDDAWDANEVIKILDCIDMADIVIPYIKNAADKSRSRKLLSKTYTYLINKLFCLEVPYYNGIVVHKRALINKISINSNDFSYQTEALIKIIKNDSTYITVESNTSKRNGGKSKALSLANIVKVISSVIYLYIQITINAKK